MSKNKKNRNKSVVTLKNMAMLTEHDVTCLLQMAGAPETTGIGAMCQIEVEVRGEKTIVVTPSLLTNSDVELIKKNFNNPNMGIMLAAQAKEYVKMSLGIR